MNLGLQGPDVAGPEAVPGTPGSWADLTATWVTWALAAGKFFSQFSILFGLSLAMQLERGAARGQRIGGLWIRRMLVLFTIGWANAILFWANDILRAYAIAGTVLLIFRNRSNRVVLVAAAVAFILMLNDQTLSQVALRIARVDAAAVAVSEQVSPDQQRRRQEYERAQQTGNYLENVRARGALLPARYVGRLLSGPTAPLNLISMQYLPFVLIGFYVGRRRILQDAAAHRAILRRAARLGFAVGLPLNVLLATAPEWLQRSIPGTGAKYWWVVFGFATLTLAVGYLAGLALLLSREEWRARFSWLAAVGRMGLSNYVAQGIFINALMLGDGFGWSGRSGAFANTLAAGAFFAVQIAYSNWWLSRFRFGPLEWLWRRATYWRPVPMRNQAPVTATAQ